MNICEEASFVSAFSHPMKTDKYFIWIPWDREDGIKLSNHQTHFYTYSLWITPSFVGQNNVNVPKDTEAGGVFIGLTVFLRQKRNQKTHDVTGPVVWAFSTLGISRIRNFGKRNSVLLKKNQRCSAVCIITRDTLMSPTGSNKISK